VWALQTRKGPPERAPVSWAGPCSGAKTFGLKTLEHLLGWRGGNRGFAFMIEGFRV